MATPGKNTPPIPKDANNDRILDAGEFGKALTDDHAAFPGRKEAGIAHSMLMPFLEGSQRVEITSLSRELQGFTSSKERKAEIRTELESILEGAASKGLESLNTRVDKLNEGIESGKIPADKVGQAQEAKAMMEQITSTFDKVDFSPENIEEVARHAGGGFASPRPSFARPQPEEKPSQER